MRRNSSLSELHSSTEWVAARGHFGRHARGGTVVIYSLSQLNAVKEELLARVLRSAPNLPLAILVDGDAPMRSAAATLVERERALTSAPVRVVPVAAFPTLLNSSHRLTRKRDGSIQCPQKLSAARWCAASSFAHCWHLEDDVYVRDMARLDADHAADAADVLPAHSSHQHPFWVHTANRSSGYGWVAREQLMLDTPEDAPRFFWLAAYRMSRAFARAVLRTLDDDGALNMCISAPPASSGPGLAPASPRPRVDRRLSSQVRDILPVCRVARPPPALVTRDGERAAGWHREPLTIEAARQLHRPEHGLELWAIMHTPAGAARGGGFAARAPRAPRQTLPSSAAAPTMAALEFERHDGGARVGKSVPRKGRRVGRASRVEGHTYTKNACTLGIEFLRYGISTPVHLVIFSKLLINI